MPIDAGQQNSIEYSNETSYQSALSTGNGETISNKITTQQVGVKEQATSTLELHSQATIYDTKQTKISWKKEAQENSRHLRTYIRAESIEENTSGFTYSNSDGKVASSATSQGERLASATRDSCSSQAIAQSSVIVNQSSAFRTLTGTRQEYLDTSERSPVVRSFKKKLSSLVNLTFALLEKVSSAVLLKPNEFLFVSHLGSFTAKA